MSKKSKAPSGFPTSIRIHDQDWKVKYKKCITKEEFLLGACDHVEHTIYIDTTQSRETMVNTLLHEIMHVLFRLYPILEEDNEEVEEKLTLMLTNFVLSVLRSNDNLPWVAQ